MNGRTLTLAALVLLAPATARADEPSGTPSAAARTEAHDRFERAVQLFNANDNAAALAEFKRVYELVPNPVVLYNIGLVYAAMGRPVEAVDAFDKLLAAPGALSAERLERSKTTRADQAARIATLAVKVNVDGAAIEVDNVEVAKAPLASPLRIVSGTHIVGALAPGYAPARKEVTVAGRTDAKLELELTPLTGRLSHLVLKTKLPGAQVVIDGQAIATTPLATSLALAPGQHRVELRRAGYVTARQDLLLGDGSTGEVTMEPEDDEASLAEVGGTLALAISERDAIVSIDGKPRGAYTASLRLAHGVHRVRVERAGFRPYEREVTVPKGETATAEIRLDPTPETLEAYVSNARAHRVWGWVGIGVGAALAGAGTAFIVYNAGPKGEAQASYDELEKQRVEDTGICNTSGGADAAACNEKVTAASDKLNAIKLRDIGGWVGIGVGAAAVVTGIVVLATGKDPRRYDRKDSGEKIAGVRLQPQPLVMPGGGGFLLTGAF